MSDVRFSWVVKAIVATLLGLTAAGVQRAFYISSKIDVLDARTLAIEVKADAAAATAAHVKDELDRAKDDATRRHEQFLTRDEFYHAMSPELSRGGQPK